MIKRKHVFLEIWKKTVPFGKTLQCLFPRQVTPAFPGNVFNWLTLAFRGNFPNMVKRKQSNAKLQVTTYLPDNRRKK